MDVWTVLYGFVNLVLGVFLGAWYNEYRKRPLLMINGSGSGGGDTFKDSHLSVSNPPGFIGIDLPSSAIFGRQVHPPLRRALSVDRNPATQCHAYLVEKDTGRHVTGLYWRPAANGEGYATSVTIGPGEARSLMLFARLSSERTKYFVFAPDANSPHGIRVPDEDVKFTGDRRFELRINYSNGQRLTADVGVRKDYNGNLYVESGSGSSSSRGVPAQLLWRD